MQQLYQEVQSYQQLFVDLHRATSANTPTGEDAASLKAKLVQLDSHKIQLHDKLNKLRGKVQNVSDLPALQVRTAAVKQSLTQAKQACSKQLTVSASLVQWAQNVVDTPA